MAKPRMLFDFSCIFQRQSVPRARMLPGRSLGNVRARYLLAVQSCYENTCGAEKGP